MPRRPLPVFDVDEAPGYAVWEPDASFPKGAPLYSGAGKTDLICGGCEYLLMQGYDPATPFENVALRCPQCRKLNLLNT